jgi:hypothetical protein
MLRVPTDAPQDLQHLFNYQLTVLNSIRVEDEELEAESGQVCFNSCIKGNGLLTSSKDKHRRFGMDPSIKPCRIT